jgi:Rod binding domain-containing protein
MDGIEPILSLPAMQVSSPEIRAADNKSRVAEIAKGFESVLLSQLANAMKETVNALKDDEEDPGAGQVQGLFWLYLSRDAADNGGLGLWKDLYRFFSDLQNPDTASQSLDENL